MSENLSVPAEVVVQAWEDPAVGMTEDEIDAVGVVVNECCPELPL